MGVVSIALAVILTIIAIIAIVFFLAYFSPPIHSAIVTLFKQICNFLTFGLGSFFRLC